MKSPIERTILALYVFPGLNTASKKEKLQITGPCVFINDILKLRVTTFDKVPDIGIFI